MKVAICPRNNSFSERWISYCQQNNIEYKLVNPYANDVVNQVSGCTAFMWHFHQGDYRDMQFAKSLIRSLETKGVRCFPDSNTCWHFDDKVAQKYLMETVDVPLVPSYVFYTKTEALQWANTTTYPKVFKLKGGAGANNVMLARTKKNAVSLIKQSFGKGFRQYRWREHFMESWRLKKIGKNTFHDVLRTLYYAIKKYPTEFDHYHGREIGYVYFQDFIPNNFYDLRVCVVGDKAFALKRMTRKNDFRASGSGNIVYDKAQMDERCVKMAFDVNQKLRTQSVAYDFVFDDNNNPLIVEISYGYAMKAYDKCEGYWTSDMQWHEGCNFDFCGWMVENLIKQ